MNLQDPTKKMSKSDSTNRGRIDLTDPPEVIRQKIKKAVTDSTSNITYDSDTRPGVANLIDIMSSVSDLDSDKILDMYGDREFFTKGFKADLSDRLIVELESFREMYQRLSNEKQYLHEVIDNGSRKARDIASTNIIEIKKKLGLES